jgi:hypothetical protein
MKFPATFVLALPLLCSCALALPPPSPRDLQAEVGEAAREARPEILPASAVVRETDEPYIHARVVEYLEPGRFGVSVKLAQASLGDALQAIARPRGYGVAFVGNARPAARVSIEVSNMAFASAVRELSLAAGLVAVVDERRQQVLVADEATYVFRLPPFLVERQRTNYSVQSNPGPAGGAEGSAAGGPAAPSSGTGASASPAASPASRTGGTSTVVQGSATRSADALIAALAAITGGPAAQRVHCSFAVRASSSTSSSGKASNRCRWRPPSSRSALRASSSTASTGKR